MSIRSSPTPELSELKVKVEDTFGGRDRLIIHTILSAEHKAITLATEQTSLPMGDNQDAVESLRLKINSLGLSPSESDDLEKEVFKKTEDAISPTQPSSSEPQAPLVKSKGGISGKGFTLGPQHAKMLLLDKHYFIVFPNVYCFDVNRIICRVDNKDRYHEADMKPNPPVLETCFYVDGMPYWFDSSSQLWYNISGEWLPEVLHSDLARARMELARSAENNLMSGMSMTASSSGSNHGAAAGHDSDDDDVYPPQPLSPQPDQAEIDSWFEEFKNRRNALFKTRDRLSDIRCPIQSCRKTQRRPQALRDHLYFHFGVKPFKCDYGCPNSFETEANKNRHLETCGFRPSTRR